MSQPIGYFNLTNSGAFVAKGGVSYNGGDHGYTGDIDNPKSETYDLTQFGAADGDTVQIYVDVVFGRNNEGAETFTYQPGNPGTANYTIYGSTLDNQLTFNGIS